MYKVLDKSRSFSEILSPRHMEIVIINTQGSLDNQINSAKNSIKVVIVGIGY